MKTPNPFGVADEVPRGDYAMNSGATLSINYPGPPNLTAGDAPTYIWPDLQGRSTPIAKFTGISHVHGAAHPRNLEDGASATYLIGEKYLDPSQYENGESRGDNESLFSGYASDNHRFTSIDEPPLTPALDGTLPLASRDNYRFGSSHSAGAVLAFCDGSVQIVTFDVSPEIHYRRGHVADGGEPLP
jgi:hypothetical protein